MEENSQDYSDVISKSSKFNGAISQIYRLDELWKDSHRHSRGGELERWNWDLDRVWVELAGDFDEEDKRNQDFNNLNNEIAELKSKIQQLMINKIDFAVEYYKLLNKKELFLRRLQNKLGKGTEFEDDDDILE